MTARQSVLLVILSGLLFLPSTACVLFESSRYTPLAESRVATGTPVSLAEEARAGWGGLISRTIVLQVGDDGRTYRADATKSSDRDFTLHTIGGTDRFFVVAHPSNRVVFSMDAATAEVWDGDVQPAWATLQ